jgi:coproporphyrinogen III oxidase
MTIDDIIDYFKTTQATITQTIETFEPKIKFQGELQKNERGHAKPQILSDGTIIEKAAVNFTHSIGQKLPPAATVRKPELAGSPFQAVAISLIVHPQNPYVPTTHANLRFFLIGDDISSGDWWFGGGFDLTPYYPFLEDVVHWHQMSKNACVPFGEHLYPQFKDACDEYFYIPHRKETRGVGGLFFEDLNTGDSEQDFALVRSIGDHFLKAYLPILKKRYQMPFGEKEREHQLLRRGRYAEFNLIYDRGTKYGLQSGRRIESVLASMPPVVKWGYQYQPEEGSPEADIFQYLHPRDWLS